MANIREVSDLEQVDWDISRGSVIKSILQRTFGGRVAGQSLVAATYMVGNIFAVDSLHAYSVGPGRLHIPTVCMVKRIRDGRSSCHRSIEAVRDGRTIFAMQVSLHRREDGGLERSDVTRKVPDPEDAVTDTSGMTNTHHLFMREWVDWGI